MGLEAKAINSPLSHDTVLCLTPRKDQDVEITFAFDFSEQLAQQVPRSDAATEGILWLSLSRQQIRSRALLALDRVHQ